MEFLDCFSLVSPLLNEESQSGVTRNGARIGEESDAQLWSNWALRKSVGVLPECVPVGEGGGGGGAESIDLH